MRRINPLVGILALVVVATVIESQRATKRPRLRAVPKPTPTNNAPPATPAPAPPPVATVSDAPKPKMTPWGTPQKTIRPFVVPEIPDPADKPILRSADFEAWINERDAQIEAMLHAHDHFLLSIERYRWQRANNRERAQIFADKFVETLTQRMVDDPTLRARLVALYDMVDMDAGDEIGALRFRTENQNLIFKMRFDIAQRILYPDEHVDSVSAWMREEYRKFAARMGGDERAPHPQLEARRPINLLTAASI